MKTSAKTKLIALIILIAAGCTTGNSGNGIVGIVVPVGSGKVSDDTPYTVSGVYEDTPAFKAGIRPGDIIVQINDMPITKGMRFDDIYSTQLKGKPGTKVVINIRRGEENLIFSLTRAERGD